METVVSKFTQCFSAKPIVPSILDFHNIVENPNNTGSDKRETFSSLM